MRLSHSILLAALLIPCLAASAAPAARAADDGLAAARADFRSAVSNASAPEIRKARDAFALLQAGEPGSAERAYWLALADWRLVPMLPDSEKTSARQLVKEGIAACDRALAARPRFADAVALRAALQGLAFQFMSPQAGMALGAEMEEGFGRASGMEPGNPRVLLLKGVNALHKPKEVGGGPDKAKPIFEAAIAAFAKESPGDAAAIDWGRDDALLWSGICASRLGDWTAAKARFQEVLAVNPAHAWTKHVLLPEAEKQLAAKAGSAK